MKNKIIILLVFLFLITGCTRSNKADNKFYDSPKENSKQLYELQNTKEVKYEKSVFGEIDLRSITITDDDISEIDIESLNDFIWFNTDTKWKLSNSTLINPEELMSSSFSPGLNVNKLHEDGITGKGVNIAIIDQPLLIDHTEYKDQLKLYTGVPMEKHEYAHYHGAAVSSIAVGKNIGVAPEAGLYYINCNPIIMIENERVVDYSKYAESIDYIVDLNKELEATEKIRIISISSGVDKSSGKHNLDYLINSIEKAEESNITVLFNIDSNYMNYFTGVKKNHMLILMKPNHIPHYLNLKI